MKIAIVGSRGYKDMKKVRDYISQLPLDSVIISGGAEGVDRQAVGWARALGMETEVFKPEWHKYGNAAGVMRNSIIVGDCDRLVAFWDGSSRGTKDSIDKARLAGKPVEVILE